MSLARRGFEQIGDQIVQLGTCAHVKPSPLTYFVIYRFARSIISSIRDSDVAIFIAVTQEVIREAREKYKVPIIVLSQTPLYLRRLPDWNDDKIVTSLRGAGADVLEYDFPNGSKYHINGDGTHSAGECRLRTKIIRFRA